MSWWSVIKRSNRGMGGKAQDVMDEELDRWFREQSLQDQQTIFSMGLGNGRQYSEDYENENPRAAMWLDKEYPGWREKNDRHMDKNVTKRSRKNKPLIKDLDSGRWIPFTSKKVDPLYKKDFFVYWGAGENFAIDYENAKKMADVFHQVDVTGKPDDFQMMWNGKTLGKMEKLNTGRDEEFNQETGEYLGRSKLYTLTTKIFGLPYLNYQPDKGEHGFAPPASKRTILENRKEPGGYMF
tara:strand:+ start:1051 stop:1767 length:717 start_codon:yes stop_codon:yes gene_type:complete